MSSCITLILNSHGSYIGLEILKLFLHQVQFVSLGKSIMCVFIAQILSYSVFNVITGSSEYTANSSRNRILVPSAVIASGQFCKLSAQFLLITRFYYPVEVPFSVYLYHPQIPQVAIPKSNIRENQYLICILLC